MNYIDFNNNKKLFIIEKTISLNFLKWKNRSYTFLSCLYDGFLIYGHIAIALCIILLSSINFSIFNIIILLVCISFLYYVNFRMSWPFRIN